MLLLVVISLLRHVLIEKVLNEGLLANSEPWDGESPAGHIQEMALVSMKWIRKSGLHLVVQSSRVEPRE